MNSTLKQALVVGAVASIGLAVKAFLDDDYSPDQEEADALRELDKLNRGNPFDMDNLQAGDSALRKLSHAHAMKELQRLHDAGYPSDTQVEEPFVQLNEHRFDWGGEAFSKAFTDFLAAVRG